MVFVVGHELFHGLRHGHQAGAELVQSPAQRQRGRDDADELGGQAHAIPPMGGTLPGELIGTAVPELDAERIARSYS